MMKKKTSTFFTLARQKIIQFKLSFISKLWNLIFRLITAGNKNRIDVFWIWICIQFWLGEVKEKKITAKKQFRSSFTYRAEPFTSRYLVQSNFPPYAVAFCDEILVSFTKITTKNHHLHIYILLVSHLTSFANIIFDGFSAIWFVGCFSLREMRVRMMKALMMPLIIRQFVDNRPLSSAVGFYLFLLVPQLIFNFRKTFSFGFCFNFLRCRCCCCCCCFARRWFLFLLTMWC